MTGERSEKRLSLVVKNDALVTPITTPTGVIAELNQMVEEVLGFPQLGPDPVLSAEEEAAADAPLDEALDRVDFGFRGDTTFLLPPAIRARMKDPDIVELQRKITEARNGSSVDNSKK